MHKKEYEFIVGFKFAAHDYILVPSPLQYFEELNIKRLRWLEERLDCDLQGTAWHVQVKLGDHIRMENPYMAYHLTQGHHLCTPSSEESWVWGEKKSGKGNFNTTNTMIFIWKDSCLQVLLVSQEVSFHK